jgi:hypothetical protein
MDNSMLLLKTSNHLSMFAFSALIVGIIVIITTLIKDSTKLKSPLFPGYILLYISLGMSFLSHIIDSKLL